MNQYHLILFGEYGNRINPKPIAVQGDNLPAIAPKVIEQMERYPLGKLKAILVYEVGDGVDNFEARYTIADYLEKRIPKPEHV